jgi:autotransporter translocation and assembly factor TamB
MTGVPIDGAAEFTALLAGSTKRPLVAVDLLGSSLSAAGLTDATLQLQASYSPDRLELNEAQLQWRGQKASASGRIDLGSSPHLHLEAMLISFPSAR